MPTTYQKTTKAKVEQITLDELKKRADNSYCANLKEGLKKVAQYIADQQKAQMLIVSADKPAIQIHQKTLRQIVENYQLPTASPIATRLIILRKALYEYGIMQHANSTCQYRTNDRKGVITLARDYYEFTDEAKISAFVESFAYIKL